MKKLLISSLLLTSLNVQALELSSMNCKVVDSKVLDVSSGKSAKDPEYGNQWDKGKYSPLLMDIRQNMEQSFIMYLV